MKKYKTLLLLENIFFLYHIVVEYNIYRYIYIIIYHSLELLLYTSSTELLIPVLCLHLQTHAVKTGIGNANMWIIRYKD